MNRRVTQILQISGGKPAGARGDDLVAEGPNLVQRGIRVRDATDDIILRRLALLCVCATEGVDAAGQVSRRDHHARLPGSIGWVTQQP